MEKQPGRGSDQPTTGNLPYTPRLKTALAISAREAVALEHTYVGTEHLLLGLLRDVDGPAGRILKNLNVDLEKMREEILQELNPCYVPPFEPGGATGGEKLPSDSITVKLPTRSTVMTKMTLRDPVDITQRYDVYCVERNQRVVVYRNVLFKAVQALFQRNEHDTLSDFVELEQADGTSVFVARTTVIRFCKHGVKCEPEEG
jgi:ATP-dependent Clp protease ATP-binding subunit ClpC